MSFVKLLVHSVWSTKYRKPILDESSSKLIYKHIRSNSFKKQIYVDQIDGGSDHIHCLFYLPRDLTVSKAMQLIKGESSHWINNSQLFKSKFQWAEDYYAVSVGPHEVERVRQYILKQREHHRKVTFEEVYGEFIKYYQAIFKKEDPDIHENPGQG